MSKLDRPKRRMLLVASIGVATVSYALAGCGKTQPPGNLAQPPTITTAEPPMDAAASAPPSAEPQLVAPTIGNLMAPPEPVPTTSASVRPKAPTPPPPKPKRPPTSGNLMAPHGNSGGSAP